MSDFLVYKWIILLLIEVVAWSATFFMLYARYRLTNPVWFKLGVVVTVLTGVLPQIAMGVANYYLLGELDMFSIVIVLLIVYGFTIGKSHMRRLDAWMFAKYGGKD